MSRIHRSILIASLAALLTPIAAHAADFDVEKASRAYLDLLQGPAREKSDAYFEGGYWLLLWGTLVSMLSDAVLLRFRLTAKARSWAEARGWGITRQTWLTGLFYSIAGVILTLPWSIYTGFIREKQYALMNQSFGAWLGDQAVSLVISLALMPLIIMAIYAAIRRFPRGWWLLGTGIVSAFLLVGVVIAPVFIAPLFNTYTELPQGPVRDRIVAMAKANNVPAEHIYLFDASRQTKRISANVSGLGPTIRISLNDNLLNRTSEAEVAAVMGHELGHYVLNHVWQLVFAMAALIAALLFIASRLAPWLITRYGEKWGVRSVGDPASLPVLGIILAAAGLIAAPVQKSLVRMNESAADAFGLDAAKEPDAFALVAMRLSEYRKIEPGKLEEMLFFDHPSGSTRVHMAMQWKKDHVPGATMVQPPPLPQEGPEEK